jgi:hypothetical protein
MYVFMYHHHHHQFISDNKVHIKNGKKTIKLLNIKKKRNLYSTLTV